MSGFGILEKLLSSKEPAIRLKTYTQLLDYDFETKEVQDVIKNIKTTSNIISSLLAFLPKNLESKTFHVYTKWQGAHWILASLADLGYPPEDPDLIPSRDSELLWLLSPERWNKVPEINGRKRFCASQDGNGLYSILKLKIYDKRVKDLAKRLVDSQWADGGWNCDKKSEVKKSSYHESLIPLRALSLYYTIFKDSEVKTAIDKAAELFLKRALFKRLFDGKVIKNTWLLLHYPPFWHYDILMSLKVLAEANKISDKRCSEALDILESKRLPDDGFPAEAKYYQSNNETGSYFCPAEWGGVNKRRMNEWVTIDALFILKKAKRIDIDL